MEANLYLPVKRFLERLGFEVKGEFAAAIWWPYGTVPHRRHHR